MNTTLKLAALILVITGLSSCGKMGELEPVKAESVAMNINTTAQADIV
jgi:predicted small lipoprotein YifL